MSVNIGNITFKPGNFSDSPVGYLNGSITNVYKAVVPITIQKYTVNQKRLQFSGNTISNINAIDNDSFISTYGFAIGEQIIIPMSVHNSGNLIITGLTDKTITVSTSLTAEILEMAYIYMNGKITALDYYYNLLNNSEPLSFISKTDRNTLQKYTVTGIDPTVGAPVYLQVGTKSFAWVADVVTAPTQTTSTISGTGFSGYLGMDTAAHIAGSYIQSFTITHYFVITPVFLAPLFLYFQTDTPTPDFQDGQLNGGSPINQGYQYVCQVNAKYVTGPAYYNTGQSFGIPGNTAWFDQNDSRTTPEFTTASVAYTNAVGGASMPAIDIGQSVNVAIKIKSASGLFTNVAGEIPGTTIVLWHFYCPLDEASYQNTPTTLLQNFMNDGSKTTLGHAAVQGYQIGTNYQVITNVLATYVDAYNATITFNVTYTAFLKAILGAKGTNDRNILLTVSTETTTD